MGAGLAGKVVLVTGASRGIGEGVARAVAAEGAVVVCGARDLGKAVNEFKKGMRGEDEATPNPPTAQNGSGATTPPQDSANRDNVVR